MERKQITIDDIKLAFDFRNHVNITNGNTLNYKVIAVPINEKEKKEIIKAARIKAFYKEIPSTNFVSIGDPKSPTRKILDLLPYIYINNSGKNNAFKEIGKSYFYPPMNDFPTIKNHAIPFEDAHSLWSYYMNHLMQTEKYNDVVLIKLRK